MTGIKRGAQHVMKAAAYIGHGIKENTELAEHEAGVDNVKKGEASRISDSLEAYHASHRSPAVVNCNGNDMEIGRVFAEYKDKLVIIDGENKKEHEYLIPKTKIDRYGDNQVYFDIPRNSLNEFEV